MTVSIPRFQNVWVGVLLAVVWAASAGADDPQTARFIHPGETHPTFPAVDLTGGPFHADAEPEGFRGIPWGTSIGDVEGMTLITTTPEGVAFYNRADDEMKIGDAPVERIHYGFHEGRFHAALVYVLTDRTLDEPERYETFEALKKAVFDQYGAGRPGNTYGWGEEYRWQGEQAEMLLSRNGADGTCSLLIKRRTDQGGEE